VSYITQQYGVVCALVSNGVVTSSEPRSNHIFYAGRV